VEHAYPSKLLGVARSRPGRHATALRELRPEEFAELGSALGLTVRALRETVGSAKEYVACFAEQSGFEHVHFHVVPRAADLPSELRGTNSFAFLKVSESEAVAPGAVRTFCEAVRAARFPPDAAAAQQSAAGDAGRP